MKSFWSLKKTKELKPRYSLWNIGLSARKPFKDSDKDKVIDIFDCQPHNRKKQGPEHEDNKGSYKLVEETAGGDKREWRKLSKKRAGELYDWKTENEEWPKSVHTTLVVVPDTEED